MPGPFARGYELFNTDRLYTDVTLHNMSWAKAAGALISTPTDVNSFYEALLQGRLLPHTQLNAMKNMLRADW